MSEQFQEKTILRIYRLLGFFLIFFTIFFLLFFKTSQKWTYIFWGWVFLFFGIILYRDRVYRRIHKNFETVLAKTEGTIKRGSAILAIPPSLKFRHWDRQCLITHTVDHKFDTIIEFICPTEKEIELRVIHAPQSTSQKKKVSKRYIVQGEHKHLFNVIMQDPQQKGILESLMSDFSGLFFGKDCRLRLVQNYESCLIEPNKVVTTFEQMIKLSSFLENQIPLT